MCGVIGSYGADLATFSVAVKKLLHRGPDNHGIYRDGDLLLGHTRLSILDLDDRSNQPMESQCGNYIIVFNGEVYNYKDLRKKIKNYNFTTSSDTEVILAGFIDEGSAFFKKLNGMYAFCIYDRRNQELILARDRFGIKPLYFTNELGKPFVFSSEINALRKIVTCKDVDIGALVQYMHFSAPYGENTFFKGIKSLKPGFLLRYDLKENDLYCERYIDIYDELTINEISWNEAIDQTDLLMQRAVKRQLNADVDVGVFLSGGLDSSLITAYSAINSSKKINTYTATFDHNFHFGESELANAKLVASTYGCSHTQIHVPDTDIPSVLDQTINCFDQPFADAANVPLFLMSKELPTNAKVILQGDGGDELFAGYNQYSRFSSLNRFKYLINIFLYADKCHLIEKFTGRKIRSLYAFGEKNLGKKFARLYSHLLQSEQPSKIFSGDLAERVRSECFSQFHETIIEELRPKCLGELETLMLSDMKLILANLYLVKVDRSTMANSKEMRVPFLDNDLANFAMGLSAKMKLRNNSQKALLRTLGKRYLPDRLISAPKRGFSAPFQIWLKTSLKDDVINLRNNSSFISEHTRRLIDFHLSGKYDHGYLIWKLLILDKWIQKNELKL